MSQSERDDELDEGLRYLLVGSDLVQWQDRDLYQLLDPNSWLIVESGEIDLFAAQLGDGQPRGAWYALARLGPGDVVAGTVAGPQHRVLCRRVRDAQVRVLGLAELRDRISEELATMPDGGPRARALASGIVSAVRKTNLAVERALPPRDFVPLRTGAVYELGQGDTARPVDSVLWVELMSGHAELGTQQDRFSAGDLVCMTRRDWVTLPGTSVMRTRSTLDLVRTGQIWRLLITHWSRFLYNADRAVERDLMKRRASVRRACERDDGVEVQAREEYDSLLVAEGPGVATEPVEGDYPGHVEAIVRVLDALGDDAEVPDSVRHRRRLGDFDDIGTSGWVRTRSIRLEGQWWTRDMGPLVGYWGPDHLPVALLRTDGVYVAHSSLLESPERVTSENQFSAGRSAWVIYPRLPAQVTTVKELFGYGFRGLRPELWLFGTMAVLVGLFGLLTPVLNGQILGSYVGSANRPMIVQAGIAVIASALVAAAFSVVQNLVVLRIQGAVTAKTQAGVWGRLMDLPVTFFERFSTGRLGTVILSVKSAQELLSGVVVAATLGLVVVLANLVLVFVYSITLALAAMALAAVAVAVCWWNGRTVLHHERDRFEAEQRLTAMSYETLSAITKVRGAAAEERAFRRWSRQQRSVQAHTLASRRYQDRVTVFNAVYPLVSLAALFSLANLPSEPLPLSSLLSFMTAFTLLINALLQFTGSVLMAAAMVPMIESLAPVLAARPESGVGRAHPGELSGDVALRGVSFRYGDDGPLALDDVTIDVQPGEFVAIVGPSGSGKSTVIRLMLGFDSPLQGSVLYDGQDLAELDLSAVRGQCGVVLQSGSLMPGDIRDNIAGGGHYDEDDIWQAAEMAGLKEMIQELPMGLSTVVNETSHGLSGGQVQRLMIARALVNRPRFVIFDEATSALDNPTQRVVAEATRELNATRIVVAHRLSTVRDADRIFVMERGAVVQQGSYDELVRDTDGLFAQLVRRQSVSHQEAAGA